MKYAAAVDESAVTTRSMDDIPSRPSLELSWQQVIVFDCLALYGMFFHSGIYFAQLGT